MAPLKGPYMRPPQSLYELAERRFHGLDSESAMRAIREMEGLHGVFKVTSQLVERKGAEASYAPLPGYGRASEIENAQTTLIHLPTKTTIGHIRYVVRDGKVNTIITVFGPGKEHEKSAATTIYRSLETGEQVKKMQPGVRGMPAGK